MKKILLFAVFVFPLLILTESRVSASEIAVDSKIVKVAIYPGSALLTRTAVVQVTPGQYQFKFDDIIPNLDENSIRVKAQGSARARIFGAQHKREYLQEKPAAQVQELEKELEALTNKKRELIDSHNVVMLEREWLNSLRMYSQEQLPRDLVTKVPQTKDISDLLNFLDANFKQNFIASYEYELKIKELDKKIEVVRNKLAEIQTPNRMKRSIVVEAEVLKAGSLEINLSYLVYGANWQPVYDARALFDKSETEFVSYGIVRQTTGENWDDVELVLSGAKPSIGGRMPEPASWFLRAYQPQRARLLKQKSAQYEPYYMQDEMRAESVVAGGSISDGRVKEEMPMAPAEVAYATAELKAISVTYKIPRKATIKSDGTEARLPVSSQDLASRFKYSAFPKGSEYAYLAAEVTNDKQLQLPAGRVNVFLDEDFVGSSSIDNIGPQETFDLFLGVDENVKVKREQLEKKIDDVIIANIPSPNKKITLKYKITVENYKNRKINFELFEAVPVSQDERIKVKIEKVSLEPKDKDYKDKKGIWRWEFELKPAVKAEIFYTVVVEYPRNMQVEGL